MCWASLKLTFIQIVKDIIVFIRQTSFNNRVEFSFGFFSPGCIVYLIQNSQAVKKVCGPQKGYGEKRCEIQGGGQEMAVMVG